MCQRSLYCTKQLQFCNIGFKGKILLLLRKTYSTNRIDKPNEPVLLMKKLVSKFVNLHENQIFSVDTI